MTWETFKGGGKSYRFPVVSILRNGKMALNKGVIELLEDSREVVLEWDKEGQRIGLKPVKRAHAGTRRVSYGEHNAGINVKMFLERYGIDYHKSRSYSVEKDGDGRLILNLQEPL